MGAAVHRRATLEDATLLFEVRRKSILELTAPAISFEEAGTWAMQLTPSGMERKLRELEIWVAELDGTVAGWGAVRSDYLEGLYTAPEYAGRGVGSALLDRLEGLLRGRGVAVLRAEASSNASGFYFRRGYRAIGPQTPEGAWPMTKQLLT